MISKSRIILYVFSVLIWGLSATSCTIVTDPTKSSSDFTSSTSPGSSSKPSPEEKAKSFANENFERLQEDMALGGGEHLASLATLLGVPNDRQPEFFALAKEQFPSLVNSAGTTSNELIAALDRELAMRPYLREEVPPH
jgi:Protein of unknown function (DUF3015)